MDFVRGAIVARSAVGVPDLAGSLYGVIPAVVGHSKGLLFLAGHVAFRVGPRGGECHGPKDEVFRLSADVRFRVTIRHQNTISSGSSGSVLYGPASPWDNVSAILVRNQVLRAIEWTDTVLMSPPGTLQGSREAVGPFDAGCERAGYGLLHLSVTLALLFGSYSPDPR